MHNSLSFQYMVVDERARLVSDPTLSRRAVQERELSLAVALTSERGPSLSGRFGALVSRALDSVRPAGIGAGAAQG